MQLLSLSTDPTDAKASHSTVRITPAEDAATSSIGAGLALGITHPDPENAGKDPALRVSDEVSHAGALPHIPLPC